MTAVIANLAVSCLELEATTYPKPGLVSTVDSGSHDDMDIDTLRRSADAIRPFFSSLAEAGAAGCGMKRLRAIGLQAEAAMLAATGGVNAHRGAIFGLGLLCAAAGRNEPGRTLGETVVRAWGEDIADGPRRYGAGGARQEAAQGFPSIYRIALPVLNSVDGEAGRVQACFALIAGVEDTNLLHRGGREGLRFAQTEARAFLEEGGVGRNGWRERAAAVHRAFVVRRLSPGGAADLLAMSLFVQAHEAWS
ncbi:triphosphoribosyl-dephospho-CoA synthase [Reyranella soli]|uniref:Probable 2-(5''-triphosphoribosyl)-3'-dephosphocoenzyme-A synthase n=1 Tax=Reyranella soli TaxID=1230389 RepID=A0A512NMA8_9HYPH|nr:triphosphoribosyl-dephospho-CoA synthase [Reyranella soli]GEP60080.1 putative 2-(5''-triphosphoribosyl)-3'-dephosphocoenzyme-A synthase [Reyranella soli]